MNLNPEPKRRLSPEQIEDIRAALGCDYELVPTRWHTEQCHIPRARIRPDGSVVNQYVLRKIFGTQFHRHVLAAALVNGEFPSLGWQVNHHCDRKCCGNPAHVYVGTVEQNAKDASDRGLLKKGDQHPLRANPERVVRGEKARAAKMTERTAGYLKWCLEHETSWFTDSVRTVYNNRLTALAVWYTVTVPSVRRIREGKSWAHVQPLEPAELPFSTCPPTGEPPLKPQMKGVLNETLVTEIRETAQRETNLTKFIAKWTARLEVSPTTIWDVLRRKTWKQVAPEIPPVEPQKHWNQHLPPLAIQQIRATFDAYNAAHSEKGIVAALARHFDISPGHAGHIARRLTRLEVPEDTTAVLPLDNLPFLPLTQRGSAHKRAKLNESKVWEILKRLAAGEKAARLAKDYGVSLTVISGINRGKTWYLVWKKFHQSRSDSETIGN